MYHTIYYAYAGIQHSWQEYIYTKCQNKPETSQICKCESTQPPAKHSKLEKRTLHSYPSIDVELEDEESDKRNLDLLVAEGGRGTAV